MFKKNLSFKLIASLSVLIMVIFLISGYATYTVYLKLFTTEISKQFAKANEQATARVETQIQNLYKATNYIVFHPYIEDILRRSAERADDTFYNRLLDQDELTKLLNQISIDEPKLSSMYVYNTKGSGYFFENNAGTVIPLSDANYTAVLRSLEGSNGELVWQPLRISSIESSGYRNVISAARYMKNKKQELYGNLILFYDQSIFGSILDELAKGENAQVILLDSNDKVVYTNAKPNGDFTLEELLHVSDSQIVKSNGESILVSRNKTRDSGMTLISTLSLKSINEKSQVIFQIALYSGLVSIPQTCHGLFIHRQTKQPRLNVMFQQAIPCQLTALSLLLTLRIQAISFLQWRRQFLSGNGLQQEVNRTIAKRCLCKFKIFMRRQYHHID
jgi:two-component system sensor histidine kinase YesM